MIPSAKEVFTATGLTSIQGGTYTGPTFAGASNGGNLTVSKTVTITDNTSPAFGQSETVTAGLEMPGGIKADLPMSAIPAPIAQLNVGFPWEMEGMVRYFPKTSLGDDGGEVKMLGLGLKKEITEWFGPLKKLPLHVSILAAFTSMDLSYGGFDTSGDLDINSGAAEFELDAYTVEAIASLNFPIINIYGGIGYGKGSSSFRMKGTYSGNYDYSFGGQNYSESITITPPSLDFDAKGFKTTIGARLSLGFFKIFGNYTIQEYNTLNAGIAISIR